MSLGILQPCDASGRGAVRVDFGAYQALKRCSGGASVVPERPWRAANPLFSGVLVLVGVVLHGRPSLPPRAVLTEGVGIVDRTCRGGCDPVNDPGGGVLWSARCAVVDADRITSFPPFADLPGDELELLAGAMSEVDVDAGASIITHGDFGYVLYAIEAGEADVVVDGSEPVRVLGPGDTSGRSRSSSPAGARPASSPAPRCACSRCSTRTSGGFGRAYPSWSARCAGSAASA